jgi:hypothetical protein
VTERARRGHGNASKKTTGRRIRAYDPDREYDEPNRLLVAPGRQYGYDCKEFSDLINPLKRYLRSCIGRPWTKVHSERPAPGRSDKCWQPERMVQVKVAQRRRNGGQP